MVFRASRKRKHPVRGRKRGGFIISIPLLIAGAVAAAKAVAVGAAMAAGGVAVEKTVGLSITPLKIETSLTLF